jgi:hypothetical protein
MAPYVFNASLTFPSEPSVSAFVFNQSILFLNLSISTSIHETGCDRLRSFFISSPLDRSSLLDKTICIAAICLFLSSVATHERRFFNSCTSLVAVVDSSSYLSLRACSSFSISHHLGAANKSITFWS